MSDQTEIVLRDQPGQSRELARPEPNIGQMLAAVLQGGITKDNTDAVKEMMGIYVQMEDRNAAKAFNSDFVQLMAEIPQIRAIKGVPDKYGNLKFMFAPLEEIEKQLRPVCIKFGFCYSFSEGAPRQGHVTKVCTVAHRGGHSRENSYSVRIGSGPPGCTESQVDAAAHSYAKRGALCDAFGIQIDKNLDADPHNEGAFLPSDQATELERRAKETNSNIEGLLKYAGADLSAKNPWATIPANRYSDIDTVLRKKEQRK